MGEKSQQAEGGKTVTLLGGRTREGTALDLAGRRGALAVEGQSKYGVGAGEAKSPIGPKKGRISRLLAGKRGEGMDLAVTLG